MVNIMRFEKLDLKKVNFFSVCESLGYKEIKTKSTAKIKIFENNNGKKIAVYLNAGGVPFYINQREPDEKGSIIDLIMRDISCDFISAKKLALGDSHIQPPAAAPAAAAVEEKRDFNPVYARSGKLIESAYLLGRGISPHISALGACKDARQARDVCAFFHRDSSGELTGYEYRGADKKGFSKGGKKALFIIDLTPAAKRLVIVESAINALSYLQLLLESDAPEHMLDCVIVSTAGRFSATQKEQIKLLILSRSIEHVTLGQDNDETGDGDRQAQELAALADALGVKSKRHKPKLNDFNDDLRARTR